MPHMNTLSSGSLARNSLVFWGTAFSLSCFRFCLQSFVVAISLLFGVFRAMLTVKGSWRRCQLSANQCRFPQGYVKFSSLLTDEAASYQHPKWRRKQNIPTCFLIRKTTLPQTVEAESIVNRRILGCGVLKVLVIHSFNIHSFIHSLIYLIIQLFIFLTIYFHFCI